MKLHAFFAATALLFASTGFAQQPNAATGSPSAQLQIAQTTQAPGTILAHGSYTIRVADRLQDRIIVQIQKSGSDTFTSLLAYPNPTLRGGSFTGPITYLTGLKGRPTLRGYAFAGGPVVEFVYPKADAVELAKANNSRVMAVDPASEGRVSLPNLTQTDMSEVTLWMLTPTPVDPTTAKPGIQAARYQAPPATDAAAPTQTASATPASAPPAYTAPAQSASTTPAATAPVPRQRVKPATSAPVQVASNTHAPRLRPDVKQLPHTASEQPLILMMGLLSLSGAAALGLRRRSAALER